MATLSVTVNVSVSGSGDLPPGEITNSHTATVASFSRDRSIFGGARPQGDLGAEIPKTGTSTAPNGTKIFGRIINAATGEQVQGWKEIATVGVGAPSGQWEGSYTGATVYLGGWCRLQVAVDGSNATPGQTSNRFCVGFTFVHSEQSQKHHQISRVIAMTSEASAETIGDNDGGFQFLYTGDDGVTPTALKIIEDGNTHSNPIAAQAATFHKAVPGLKVMCMYLTKGGRLMEQLLTTDFAAAKTVSNNFHADGAKADLLWANHYNGLDSGPGLIAALYGTEINGTLLAGVDQTEGFPTVTHYGATIEHVMAELLPEMLEVSGGKARCPLTHDIIQGFSPKPSPRGAHPTKNFQYIELSWESFPLSVAESRPIYSLGNRRVYIGPMKEMNSADPLLQGTHYDPATDQGGSEEMRQSVAYLLDNARMIDSLGLEFDNIVWTADHVTLWNSTHDITTKALMDGDPLFPVDPNSPGTLGNARVLGFCTGSGDEVTARMLNTEIVDISGNPATQGRVRIYPNSGTFSVSSKIYWAPTHDGNAWILTNGETAYTYTTAQAYRHLPVFATDIIPNTRVTVQPAYNNGEFINEANTL